MAADYRFRMARVDLGTGRIKRVELSPGISRRFLGGKALGAYLLHKNLPARLSSSASTKGPGRGQVVEPESFEKMKQEYY